MKCLVPSFVADFVQVEAWITEDDGVFEYTQNQDANYGKPRLSRFLYRTFAASVSRNGRTNLGSAWVAVFFDRS